MIDNFIIFPGLIQTDIKCTRLG